MSHHHTRRAFLGTAAAGGASILAGGLSPWSDPAAAAAGEFPWSEATIPDLQDAMACGALTSRELTLGYLQRIAALNPLLHAVIETNPHAVSIAADLDHERRRGHVRGRLHGIPVLVKDNIATDDAMQTTAGSLALVNSRVPADAVLVDRLRDAGAVILGKANLGEWANWRGNNPLDFFGWSARGGATRNPYLLSATAFGSSSGSAVAAAAGLCAVAVGTETDGSIVGPSGMNLTVGLKPTLGLVSQEGIIPISPRQDTAGPMGRTVTDVAILLGALQSPFGPARKHDVPRDYTRFLKRGALRGARIGVDRRYFDEFDFYAYPGEGAALPLSILAVETMAALGATLVDTDSGDYIEYAGDEFMALSYEFKVYIEKYLAGLRRTRMRKLADLIAFNVANCPVEMGFYGQELFELSESTGGNLDDPAYRKARSRAYRLASTGIDAALKRGKHKLDAIVAPHATNSSGPAVSGYPNLSLPVGLTPEGKPASILMYGGFLAEPKLLAFGYDLEQELLARTPPEFLGSISNPPNAGICGSLSTKSSVLTSKALLPQWRIY